MEAELALDGRWKIGPVLGRGRFSVVHRGVELDTGRAVAIKLHAARWLDASDVKARFLAGAESLRHLHHPNLVRVLDAGEHDGRMYLVMGLVEGTTLAELLATVGRMPFEEVLPIAADLLAGLGALHAAGRTHRDVKPGNVMVDRGGRAVLIDLGLLWAADGALTRGGVVEGTPEYMAPEQARGLGFVDRRSDVYGVGATLHHLLVGHPPFTGDSAEELFRKHHEEKPVRPSKLVPGLSRAIDKVILRALSKKPAKRFESAEALARALTAL